MFGPTEDFSWACRCAQQVPLVDPRVFLKLTIEQGGGEGYTIHLLPTILGCQLFGELLCCLDPLNVWVHLLDVKEILGYRSCKNVQLSSFLFLCCNMNFLTLQILVCLLSENSLKVLLNCCFLHSMPEIHFPVRKDLLPDYNSLENVDFPHLPALKVNK